MEAHTLLALASIMVLGVGAQWFAWKLHLPAIIILLLTGFVAGPVLGWLDPDALLGELLFPIVSLSVGIILFEGGLSLKLSELRQMGRTLANLLIIGASVTWVLSAISARLFLGMSWPVSILLGAVLVVTGPTVILPLLRMIRPKGNVGNLLKWEGILIDPVGATLALLVYEALQSGGGNEASVEVLKGIVLTVVVGIVLGMAGGWFLTLALRRYWIPDHLQNPVTLLLVAAVFAGSDYFQHESGLLSVTIMGIYLANQQRAHIAHIVEFKENISVLLISTLFILLAARLRIEELQQLPWTAVIFLAVMILVVRPASVWLSTLGSKLNGGERFFLMSMAPRGIVAAAVSSIFALRLAEEGYAGVELLAPVTFMVIIGTVVIYGMTAGRVANRFGLADPNPNGVLIVGAHPWACSLAQELKQEDVTVLLSDSNYSGISAARMQGFRTYFGSILSEHGEAEMNLFGIGKLVALTANDEVNSLAAVRFAELFGRAQVYQLTNDGDSSSARHTMAEHLRGRALFHPSLTHKRIGQIVAEGGVFKRTRITDEFTMDDYREHYGDDAFPLFLIDAEGTVKPMTIKDPPRVVSGTTLISLVRRKALESAPDAGTATES